MQKQMYLDVILLHLQEVIAKHIARGYLIRLLLCKLFVGIIGFSNLFNCVGGYCEALCVQQNRKEQGEEMKRWAESAWRNRRLLLAEALEMSESSSKAVVIDTRISRAL